MECHVTRAAQSDNGINVRRNVEQFLANLQNMIWSLAGVGVLSLCGYIAMHAKKFFTEHETNNQVAVEHTQVKADIAEIKETIAVLCDGVRMVIKDKMVDKHADFVHQHYATPDEKEHFEDMHLTYKALGGNGTGDFMYQDVMQMYTIAPAEFEEES